MRFDGSLKFPEIDHPGVPVQFLIEGFQAELVVEGETVGRWSLYDIHARRLVASAFQIDLDGTEVTFVADDPIDFAYRGVEHMAETWATIKSKRMARRGLAVRKSRRGTIPSRVDEMRAAMEANLDARTAPRQIAGEVTLPEPEEDEVDAAKEWDRRDEDASIPVVGSEMSAGETVIEPTEETVDSGVDDLAEQARMLEEERRHVAEERARLEEERRIAEQREADRFEAYRLEMKRLETEREELRRRAQSIEAASKPESELEPEAELRAVPGPAQEPAPEPEAELRAVPRPAHEPEPEPEAELLGPAQEAEAEPEPESEPQYELVPEPGPEPEEAPAQEPKTGPESESESRPEPEHEPEPGAEPALRKVVDLNGLDGGDGVSLESDVPGTAPLEPSTEPEPAMAGAAKDRGGLMGAVRAAFRTGSKDHQHQFVEAPGGIGITRYVCEECGFVSISV